MIEVKNLSKVFTYKDKKNQMAEKTAVDNLSLDIKAGEIFFNPRNNLFKSIFI